MAARRFGYDANLMFLFAEVPFEQRPARAAACGFTAVEMWWPFATADPHDNEVEALATLLAASQLSLVCCNFYAGDMAAGDRGVVSIPGAEESFRSSVRAAAHLAELTGCRIFNAVYGNRVPGVDPQLQDRLAVDNLCFACDTLGLLGATIVLEALNGIENPLYPLSSCDAALAARQRAHAGGASAVELMVDLYQYARLGEQPAEVLARTGAAGAIGHVQIADVPQRHEPGSGELGIAGILDPLDEVGWDGWVGLEYRPGSGSSEASLSWITDGDLGRPPSRRR